MDLFMIFKFMSYFLIIMFMLGVFIWIKELLEKGEENLTKAEIRRYIEKRYDIDVINMEDLIGVGCYRITILYPESNNPFHIILLNVLEKDKREVEFMICEHIEKGWLNVIKKEIE